MLQNIKYGFLLHHCSCKGIRRLHWPSHQVRNTFINFFKDHNHQYIRSSPVIPWNDPTLAFINAGMNQFKPVFLGQNHRPCLRATNSQKCIRVGGKHNDLQAVGCDTYHHTFFEMLGNWSFGDYFKRDACSMAWNLLTKVYKLPPECLYVTYFGGNPALNLEPDLEVQDIWKSIGVSNDRILPFGMQDNFWEMGITGPCGPCTEIHYRCLGRANAQDRVNLGTEDVIELWNLVFMQYERLKDGHLQPLSMHHVDTGMGLERITAVLNNKSSNYDTDLFLPIFNSIHRISGKAAYTGSFSEGGECLDTAYRILADHVRMFTVALADGLFPEDSYKLRRIMRRAILISKETFDFSPKQNGLVELTKVVAESLGDAYPEIWSQLERVQIILQQEEENVYETLHKVSKEWKDFLIKEPQLKVFTDVISPGILSGFKEVMPMIKEGRDNSSVFPNDVAVKLVESYGMNIDMVKQLCSMYNIDVDLEGIQTELENAKQLRKSVDREKWNSDKLQSSEIVLSEPFFQSLPPTDDSAKYVYNCVNGKYSFFPLETEVLALICKGQQVYSVYGNETVGVVLSCTNFYHEAGGQESDRGELVSEDAQINVRYVEKVGHTIVHWGTLELGELCVGKKLMASIDEEFRFGCMQHHTATHLLNSAIKAVTGVSCQRSSHVTHDHLSLGVRMYQTMNRENILEAENLVKVWVENKCGIQRKTLSLTELLQKPGISFLPGEVYPNEVHVISTSLDAGINTSKRGLQEIASVEPCCGTHLLNTGDLRSFCITDVKAAGVGLRNIRAVCGKTAAVAEANTEIVNSQLQKWEKNVEKGIRSGDQERIKSTTTDLKTWHKAFESEPLPYLVRIKMKNSFENMTRVLRNALRGDANKQMVEEMEEIIRCLPYGPVVHILETDFGTSKAILSKASRICKERPALIMAKAEGTVVARATVPQELVDTGASAADWLECIKASLGGVVKAPRGQDLRLVCNFRGSPMKKDNEKLKDAYLKSLEYINKYL